MESTHVDSAVLISIEVSSSSTPDADGHHLILRSRVAFVRRSMPMGGVRRLRVRTVTDISVMYFMVSDSLLPILDTV